MEKKKIKKLRLNKATLRNLDDEGLRKAAGGDTHSTQVCTVCPTQRCTTCTVVCTACNC